MRILIIEDQPDLLIQLEQALLAGSLELDPKSQIISWQHAALNLTSHEYKILAYLILNQNKIISKAELTDHVYAQDFEKDSNTIEVFIGRLRKKIPAELIKTVRGLGYQLVVEN